MKNVWQHHRSFISSIFIAILFTLALNFPFLIRVIDDGNQNILLGISNDERYYFSLIEDAADLGKNPGSSTLFEHRNAPPTASYGPIIQGSIMRYFDTDLPTVILFGNLLFPFITVFFLTLTCIYLLQSRFLGCCVSIGIAAYIGTSYLRPISPQLTLLFLSAYLWLFVTQPPRRIALFLRGIVIASLAFLHVVTVPLLLAAEGILSILRFKRGDSWQNQFKILGFVFLPIVMAFALKSALLFGADAVTLADLYRRLGLISSHLPAAPFLQIVIIGTVFALLFLLRSVKGITYTNTQFLIVLCTALLLALNQSIFHGVDIIFGLYYTLPSAIILGMSWAYLVIHYFSRHVLGLQILCLGLAIISIFHITERAWATANIRAEYYQNVSQDISLVLQKLSSLESPRVVLAPLEISDRIPVDTQHYVVTNHYAHYQWANDMELAYRYLLEQSFFPTKESEIDRTYNRVFGLAAGNIAARERTFCALRSQILGLSNNCSVRIREHIFHQELLSLLDRPSIDRLSLLRQFHVAVIITKDVPLSSNLLPFCSLTEKIGKYTMWNCSFTS